MKALRMAKQNSGEDDFLGAAPGSSERLKWYQEVLALDPDSRIFLPYARLLAQAGNSAESISIIKSGLARHPDFLEAKLELLDLLEASGQKTAAMAEASELISLFTSHPAIWDIWSRMPGVRSDMAAMLVFFSSCLKNEGFSLADVFNAGLRSLTSRAADSSAPQNPPSSPAAADCPAQEEQPLRPWVSLDFVPDDDDLPDDEQEEGTEEKPLPALPASAEPAAATAVQEREAISLPHPIPPSSTEGKCSLVTRSMAAVLEEQGAFDDAAKIYRELIDASDSDEEKEELTIKLKSLAEEISSTEKHQPQPSVIKMLEELADRLEQRARG